MKRLLILVTGAVLLGSAAILEWNFESREVSAANPGSAGDTAVHRTIPARFDYAPFAWRTVVNNSNYLPKTKKRFNSYNQPSVSADGHVVFRARGRGQPRATGIFVRQVNGPEMTSLADLTVEVPYPNNLGTMFNEFPSIPRISPNTGIIATRGNHQPVYRYDLPDGTETRVGTTGVYVMRGDGLVVTGASKLGLVPGFEHYSVPGTDNNVAFDVFPGSPAVTDDGTIVFKGNYTVEGMRKTGAFYRRVFNTPGGGFDAPEAIATTDTEIPGAPPHFGYKELTFGSVAPPSAVDDVAVFVALDNEDDPHFGGLYAAPIKPNPELVPIAEIGKTLPGLEIEELTGVGEGLSFDGRYLAFWISWGNETKTVRLYCPEEGSADRIEYCNGLDPNSVFDKQTGRWFQERQMPLGQGVIVYDLLTDTFSRIVTTEEFDDFLFWTYSGHVPGSTGDHSEGEPPRWRSSAYFSVYDGTIVFKARTGMMGKDNTYLDPIDGIYISDVRAYPEIRALAETGMDGGVLDPNIPPAIRAAYPITELGLEREALRGSYLAISAKMGSEEDGWAGIYLTNTHDPPTSTVKTDKRGQRKPGLR
ncbi:MAG: hypothetical protein IPM63_17545 [Acidobacteriota bacterium]|nr:MAG: hypothetical protein IPM63_17545 [Acidobacteriota bacterium]